MSFPIAPPINPMLSKVSDSIPVGEGWFYEPKWDGFRAIVFRDRGDILITSRNTRPLDRYFPELSVTLQDALPPRCVVDGEIVIAGNGVTQRKGLDFEALLLRIHPAASRVRMLAEQSPASFVAFDLLALDEDLRGEPFSRRRNLLESSVVASEMAFLTPQTSSAETARVWFDRFEGAGLDGVIAKRFDGPYVEGERAMTKIKHLRTADCVVAGYRLSKAGDGIGSLLLGLYKGDVLHYTGHTSSFKAAERRDLLAEMRKLEGGESFGIGRTPGGPSRWASEMQTQWTSLRPERVCEVTFDHLQGDRFRHGTRFRRWRPDKDPKECTYDQLEPPTAFDLDDIRRLNDIRRSG